jgi:hypothetical protein
MRTLGISLIVIAMSAMSLSSQQPSGSIEPPEGARVVLQAKGDGVQIYTCTGTADAIKWVLKGPDAKLMDASGQVLGTHFAGPTWKLTDGAEVKGELAASRPSPEPTSIPWLLLRAKAGSASGTLATVAFIRRTETHGGVAPASGCQASQDAGKTVQVPYTATYTFYAEK